MSKPSDAASVRDYDSWRARLVRLRVYMAKRDPYPEEAWAWNDDLTIGELAEQEAWQEHGRERIAEMAAERSAATIREVAYADAKYVLEWLRQSKAPENIVKLQERATAYLGVASGR